MRDSNSEQLGEHETDFELGVRLLAGIMEDRRNQVRSDRRCVCEAVDLDGGYQSELGTSKTGEGSFSQDDPQDRNNFGGGMRSSVSKTIDNMRKEGTNVSVRERMWLLTEAHQEVRNIHSVCWIPSGIVIHAVLLSGLVLDDIE